MHEQKCKNCAYFPCLKNQCNIKNQEGCNEFKSDVTNLIEIGEYNGTAYK